MMRIGKPSLFVKDLAGLLWTEEELILRSVSGQACPKMKNDPNYTQKLPLTPVKMTFIKGNTLLLFPNIIIWY